MGGDSDADAIAAGIEVAFTFATFITSSVVLMLLVVVVSFIAFFLIFGGRPRRGVSQSLDLLGRPTLPLRSGAVPVLLPVVFINLCQSFSHTMLPPTT